MSGTSVISYENAALILTNGDMSTTITTPGVDLQGANNYSIQAVFTGTPAGVMSLNISNDLVPVGPDGNPAMNVVNWSYYTGSSVLISSPGNWQWKIDAGGERWAQVVWTPSGGSTGTLTSITFSGKS